MSFANRTDSTGAGLDEIDRLFTRIDPVDVPATVTASIIERTSVAGRRARAVAWAWTLAASAGLAVLSVVSFFLGASLSADALDVLEAIGSDLGLVLAVPGDALLAVQELLPWRPIGLALLVVLFVAWAAGNAARASVGGSRPMAGAA